ncbi:MAG: hypothetical protein ACLQM8_11570 [Limisphaerales bacterium]
MNHDGPQSGKPDASKDPPHRLPATGNGCQLDRLRRAAEQDAVGRAPPAVRQHPCGQLDIDVSSI